MSRVSPFALCYTRTMIYTRNAWWKLTAGILALTFAYTVFLVERGTVFAGPVKCPATGHTCVNGQCDTQETCKNGGCSKDCPGNCGANQKPV
jgi:hypothetical protein